MKSKSTTKEWAYSPYSDSWHSHSSVDSVESISSVGWHRFTTISSAIARSCSIATSAAAVITSASLVIVVIMLTHSQNQTESEDDSEQLHGICKHKKVWHIILVARDGASHGWDQQGVLFNTLATNLSNPKERKPNPRIEHVLFVHFT